MDYDVDAQFFLDVLHDDLHLHDEFVAKVPIEELVASSNFSNMSNNMSNMSSNNNNMNTNNGFSHIGASNHFPSMDAKLKLEDGLFSTGNLIAPVPAFPVTTMTSTPASSSSSSSATTTAAAAATQRENGKKRERDGDELEHEQNLFSIADANGEAFEIVKVIEEDDERDDDFDSNNAVLVLPGAGGGMGLGAGFLEENSRNHGDITATVANGGLSSGRKGKRGKSASSLGTCDTCLRRHQSCDGKSPCAFCEKVGVACERKAAEERKTLARKRKSTPVEGANVSSGSSRSSSVRASQDSNSKNSNAANRDGSKNVNSNGHHESPAAANVVVAANGGVNNSSGSGNGADDPRPPQQPPQLRILHPKVLEAMAEQQQQQQQMQMQEGASPGKRKSKKKSADDDADEKSSPAAGRSKSVRTKSKQAKHDNEGGANDAPTVSTSNGKKKSGEASEGTRCFNCVKVHRKCDRQQPCSECMLRGVDCLMPGGVRIPVLPPSVLVSPTSSKPQANGSKSSGAAAVAAAAKHKASANGNGATNHQDSGESPQSGSKKPPKLDATKKPKTSGKKEKQRRSSGNGKADSGEDDSHVEFDVHVPVTLSDGLAFDAPSGLEWEVQQQLRSVRGPLPEDDDDDDNHHHHSTNNNNNHNSKGSGKRGREKLVPIMDVPSAFEPHHLHVPGARVEQQRGEEEEEEEVVEIRAVVDDRVAVRDDLPCDNCRKRHRKCDRRVPCSACRASDTECTKGGRVVARK